MMKKTLKQIACIAMAAVFLSGCSMMDNNDSTDKTGDKTPADKAKTGTDENIMNMMKHMKDNGVMYSDEQDIKNMDFAAHEGKSFVVNGKRAYLYRMKSDDDMMKKVMQQAKDTGKVKVNVDNKEMEYAAKVNGDYLLVYDMNADMKTVMDAFPTYNTGTNPEDGGGTGNSVNGNKGPQSDGSNPDLPENE